MDEVSLIGMPMTKMVAVMTMMVVAVIVTTKEDK